MYLKKGQVRSILALLNKARDRRLSQMAIQRINDEIRLVITDSFIVASWSLPDENDDLVGKVIPIEKVERWYKQTPIHEVITPKWLKANAVQDDDKNPYPSLNRFFQNKSNLIEKIAIDGKRLVGLQNMGGAKYLKMYFQGENQIIFCKNMSACPEFLGLLLPVRLEWRVE